MGARLLERTTRSLRLTGDGMRFYQQVRPLLDGIEEAALSLSEARTSVRGQLRVNVDGFFPHLALASRLPGFLRAHPDLRLDLFTTDEAGDLLAEGMDVAIRFGRPEASTPLAHVLLDTRVLTVAAPAYLDRSGRPGSPVALAGHACIRLRDPATGRPSGWEFRRGTQTLDVEVAGPLVVGDVAALLAACVPGAGSAQGAAAAADELRRDGRRVELFPDWPDGRLPLCALYPSRRMPSAKVQVFVAFCQATLADPSGTVPAASV